MGQVPKNYHPFCITKTMLEYLQFTNTNSGKKQTIIFWHSVRSLPQRFIYTRNGTSYPIFSSLIEKSLPKSIILDFTPLLTLRRSRNVTGEMNRISMASQMDLLSTTIPGGANFLWSRQIITIKSNAPNSAHTKSLVCLVNAGHDSLSFSC